jgi:hypothetical protein
VFLHRLGLNPGDRSDTRTVRGTQVKQSLDSLK